MEKEKVNLIPKGMLKQLVLGIINENPIHGYGLINKIKEETGFWKPSPGTMYPILKSMLNEGIIKEINSKDSKKQYTITPKGKKIVKSVNSLKSKMKSQVTDLFSEIFRIDKKEIEKKMDEKYCNNDLKISVRTLISLMISIGKDKTKIKKTVNVLRKTNKELAKISQE